MIVSLAWRNIWRNRRRTLITGASILFAVLFASFMEALQKGAWDNMIRGVVHYYTGYVQVQEKGFFDEQSLDLAFPLSDSLQAHCARAPGVQAVVPRLESFALAAGGPAGAQQTAGLMAIGIEPRAEDRMTGLAGRVESGRYLQPDDQGILLAAGAAELLGVQPGDTIILLSQGYRGANAAGLFEVLGLVQFGSPDLNRQMAYMSLERAAHFYAAEGLVTSVALALENASDLEKTQAYLQQHLDTTHLTVLDWQTMLPELLEAKSLDSAGNIIVYVILYTIIAFGVFGTILMMTRERMYEFGVLIAIGMGYTRLGLTVWLETLLLGIMGAVGGILCSIPLVLWFREHPIRFSGEYAAAMEKFGFEPIFPAAFSPENFLGQALVVLLITALLALYPVWRIRHLQPVQAMRT